MIFFLCIKNAFVYSTHTKMMTGFISLISAFTFVVLKIIQFMNGKMGIINTIQLLYYPK